MAIVIEDVQTEQWVERLAANLRVAPMDIVRAAISEKCTRLEKQLEVDPETIERRRQATRDVQKWFAAHGNKDPRSADEIIGYDEFGLPS